MYPYCPPEKETAKELFSGTLLIIFIPPEKESASQNEPPDEMDVTSPGSLGGSGAADGRNGLVAEREVKRLLSINRHWQKI